MVPTLNGGEIKGGGKYHKLFALARLSERWLKQVWSSVSEWNKPPQRNQAEVSDLREEERAKVNTQTSFSDPETLLMPHFLFF